MPNAASWATLLAATLLALLPLLALAGDLARAQPKTLRYHLLHTAAHPRPRPTPENPPQLALGQHPRRCLAAHHHLTPNPLNTTNLSPRPKETSTGPVEPPAPPARRALVMPRTQTNINYTAW